MALSLAELIIISLFISWVFMKAKIPPLVGMLFAGVLLGPYVLDIINPDLLAISADLRMIALIVILLRAGFELSRDTLKKVGRRALLLAFIPAITEGAAICFIAPLVLDLSYLESAILGSVIAAVSPAVVVPLMIQMIEERKGAKKGIPTMILAASSVDDVFVIVIYSVLIGIYTGGQVNLAWQLAGIPISIITGIAVGIVAGMLLYKIFDRYNPRATKRVLMILAVSILFVDLEHIISRWLPFAALLAVMFIGYIILNKREHQAHEVSARLGKIWVFAEIVLFTMVGAQVNIEVAFTTGLAGLLVILCGIVFRSLGTWLCLPGSELNTKERWFVVISYIPKATVQAAIGGAPLIAMKAAGIDSAAGEIILAVAVMSIVVTAPLGAWAINTTGKKWLTTDTEESSSWQAARESK